MKKRNMLFITLLVSILFLGGKVKATTTFEEINDISTTYTDFKEVKLSQVLEVDEGYIIYDNVASSENYVIKLIDFDGNEIWSQTYSGKVKRDTKVTMALIDDDYFIVASSEIGVLKVSVEDGSTVATLNISYSASYGNIQIVSYQDYFAILYSNSTANYVAIVDDEFNILSTTEITDDTLAIGSDDDYVYVLAYSSSYEIITIDSSYATTTLEISDFSSSLYYDGILVYFEGSLYYANDDLLEITCSSSIILIDYSPKSLKPFHI